MNDRFAGSEIPYNDFKFVGMNVSSIRDIEDNDLKKLLSGQRTDLKMFKVDDMRFEAKLSLMRNNDDSVSLMVHPVQREIKNDLGLSPHELSKLQYGEVIHTSIGGERHLVQLDLDTKELLSAKTKNINIPFPLSGTDREKLFTARSVDIDLTNGETHKFKLDLVNPRGYTLDNEAQAFRYSGSYFLSTELSNSDIKKYHLDEKDIQKLLDGKRTDILDIGEGRGKLSLLRNEDNSISIVEHPVQNEIQNNFNLTSQELDKLRSGEILTKEFSPANNPELLKSELSTEGINEKILEATRISEYNKDISQSVQIYDFESADLVLADKAKIESSLRNYCEKVGISFKEAENDPVHFRNLLERRAEEIKTGVRFGIEDDNKLLQISQSNNGVGEVFTLFNGNEDQVFNFIYKHDLQDSFLPAYEKSTQVGSPTALSDFVNREFYERAEKESLRLDENFRKDVAEKLPGGKVLIQLDRETNEIISRKEKDIPSSIKDIELSSDQRDRLRQGSSIMLNNNGETITAKMNLGNAGGIDIKDDRNKLKQLAIRGGNDDLTNIFPHKDEQKKFFGRNGIDSKNISNSARAAFDREQAIAFDRHNPGVVSFIQTDANRAEFVASLKQTNTIKLK